jgi:ribosome-binding protein aMBF1 (putative translation factor)
MPGVDLVEEIARALGASPGWLAYGQGEPGDVKEVPGCATLGERLRAARAQAGLSVRELGRRTEITYTAIQNAEKGAMPSVARVEALAEALDVSPAWLAFGEGPEKVKRRRAHR